jgi:hypothetical protein
LQFQYAFAPHRKALCKPIATLDLATPPNVKFVLLLLLLQQFWVYRNTFGALKQGGNLGVSLLSHVSFSTLACFGLTIELKHTCIEFGCTYGLTPTGKIPKF